VLLNKQPFALAAVQGYAPTKTGVRKGILCKTLLQNSHSYWGPANHASLEKSVPAFSQTLRMDVKLINCLTSSDLLTVFSYCIVVTYLDDEVEMRNCRTEIVVDFAVNMVRTVICGSFSVLLDIPSKIEFIVE